MTQKAIIVSAPSGAGKSTLVRHLLDTLPQLAFSVSACTRPARQGEIEGREYYFLSAERFREHIEACDFIEWEEVYPGSFYGTLKSEIRRIWSSEKIPVFDVDVMGGLNLKKYFRRNGLAIFIQPPSLEVLKTRLNNRATESAENLARRIAKAEQELTFASKFDTIVVNDELESSKQKVLILATAFIK